MSETTSAVRSTPSVQTPERVTEAVVTAVAEETGLSALELEPLADVVDPDALNALFESGTAVALEFTYHGFDVSVSGDGRVSVHHRRSGC